MTWLVERLADLRKHIDHLRELRPRVTGPESLQQDLSLHSDVLFSLLTVAQRVIGIAGELNSRRGSRFDDYTAAIRGLGGDGRFPPSLIAALEPLPGFRNVLVHEYVALDLRRAIEAMDRLGPIEQFLDIVAAMEREGDA